MLECGQCTSHPSKAGTFHGRTIPSFLRSTVCGCNGQSLRSQYRKQGFHNDCGTGIGDQAQGRCACSCCHFSNWAFAHSYASRNDVSSSPSSTKTGTSGWTGAVCAFSNSRSASDSDGLCGSIAIVNFNLPPRSSVHPV